MESTGRYSLGIACALYEAGHIVSIVDPAEIRDFARTKLGRNKTDEVDAAHIREYCELFKPQPWVPPSEAHRRLAELQTIRSGIVAGLTEWKNRKGSGTVDSVAQSLVDVRSRTSPASSKLSTKPSHRQSTMILVCDGNAIFCAEVVAYAGLKPRQHQSGTSIDRVTRISKIGNAVLRAFTCRPCRPCDIIPQSWRWWPG
jgi:hypothetical protein